MALIYGLGYGISTAIRYFRPSRPADDKESENCSDNHISDTKSQIDGLNRDILEKDAQIAGLRTDLENERQTSAHNTRRYEQHIFKLQEDVSRVEAEKQDALTRLSALMSVKLRDNNPNIADLSDQFRPTKLAEMFSELYDNEWTDAFTAVSKDLTERQTIILLLDIVMKAYSFCTKERDQTRSVMSEWYLTYSRNDAVEKMTDKQSQYQTYLRSICGVSTLLDMLSTKDVGKYVTQCVKLCLLMCQHDPPVVIKCQDVIEEACVDINHSDCANAPSGIVSNEKPLTLGSGAQHNPKRQPFDRDMFEEYTTGGPYLEYVVWPVMFLQQGGPMLGKGVAQGTLEAVGRWDDKQWTWKTAE